VVSPVELQAVKKATKTLEAMILLKLPTCMNLLLDDLNFYIQRTCVDSSIDNIPTTSHTVLMIVNSSKATTLAL
jgi:hypothetical protein